MAPRETPPPPAGCYRATHTCATPATFALVSQWNPIAQSPSFAHGISHEPALPLDACRQTISSPHEPNPLQLECSAGVVHAPSAIAIATRIGFTKTSARVRPRRESVSATR